MGLQIAGAVEVRGAHPVGMEHEWSRFATLEIVYLRLRPVYDVLFGTYADDGGCQTSLFGHRGLPADMTDQTEEEHARWAAGQRSGHTLYDSWFTWDEMEASHWLDEWDNGIDTDYRTAREGYNWAVMFHMLRELASFYGPENVRVVAWFVY